MTCIDKSGCYACSHIKTALMCTLYVHVCIYTVHVCTCTEVYKSLCVSRYNDYCN